MVRSKYIMQNFYLSNNMMKLKKTQAVVDPTSCAMTVTKISKGVIR